MKGYRVFAQVMIMLLCLSGIILGIVCAIDTRRQSTKYIYDEDYFWRDEYYKMDYYNGMQHAAAATANNIGSVCHAIDYKSNHFFFYGGLLASVVFGICFFISIGKLIQASIDYKMELAKRKEEMLRKKQEENEIFQRTWRVKETANSEKL